MRSIMELNQRAGVEWIRCLGNETAGWVLVVAPRLLHWITRLFA